MGFGRLAGAVDAATGRAVTNCSGSQSAPDWVDTNAPVWQATIDDSADRSYDNPNGGQLRLDRSAGLDQLISSRTAIGGLGSRCAHHIALRLGEPDAFPALDLAVRRTITTSGLLGPVEAIDRNWRPWRALAATHLWLADQPHPYQGTAPAFPEMCRSNIELCGLSRGYAAW